MRTHHALAPNPGMFTGPGTNTWVVESAGKAVVIDPGPVIVSHRRAIEHLASRLEPVAVLVTHTHPDHAPLANPLAATLGVPAVGAAPGPAFVPDVIVTEGDRVEFGGVEAICVATPGHTPDSVCYRIEDDLFTGDHIMGGSTVIVESMADYIRSLRKLAGTGLKRILPGHGPVIDDPEGVIAEYVSHRLERERQVMQAAIEGAATIGEIVEAVYTDVDPSLHPAAAISVSAHVAKLVDDGRLSAPGDLGWDAPVAPA